MEGGKGGGGRLAAENAGVERGNEGEREGRKVLDGVLPVAAQGQGHRSAQCDRSLHAARGAAAASLHVSLGKGEAPSRSCSRLTDALSRLTSVALHRLTTRVRADPCVLCLHPTVPSVCHVCSVCAPAGGGAGHGEAEVAEPDRDAKHGLLR